MGSGSKKKRGRYTSPLSAHKQSGSRVVPPLLAMEGTQTVSWLKDMLPDYVWMCAHIGDEPLEGMYAVAKTLDIIDDVLRNHDVQVASYGRLTQFEAFPEEVRTHVLEELESHGIYECSFPEEFAHALGMYPGAPGSWLIAPWFQKGLSVDPVKAEQFLSKIVTTSFHGQHLVPTRVKYMYLRGAVKAGRLHIATGLKLADYLVRYPKNISEEERRLAEPAFRAAFLSMVGNSDLDDLEADRLAWCRRFWRSNWSIYACVTPVAALVSRSDTPNHDEVATILGGFVESSAVLRSRFEEVALHVDPDIYDPDRYEVLTGITARAIRLIDGALRSPILWTTEYGAGLVRSITEAKILLRWLGMKDEDVLYSKFKSYGRGKLKLLKLHTEEYLDAMDEVPEYLTEYLEALTREVNEDEWEEYQEISIDTTFSGVSARQMAIDVGLKTDYDFVFAPASGTAHGDWTSLDRYALARCQNPLHMWHRVPDFHSRAFVDPAAMEIAISMANAVVDEYIEAIKKRLS